MRFALQLWPGLMVGDYDGQYPNVFFPDCPGCHSYRPFIRSVNYETQTHSQPIVSISAVCSTCRAELQYEAVGNLNQGDNSPPVHVGLKSVSYYPGPTMHDGGTYIRGVSQAIRTGGVPAQETKRIADEERAKMAEMMKRFRES